VIDILIFFIAYLVATLWEHYQHKHILHADGAKVKRWKNSSFWVHQVLYRGGYYAHHVVHHQKTFQKEYTRQFDSVEQREKLDAFLIKKFGKTDSEQNYGLTINTVYEYAMFVLPAFFLLPILAFSLEFYQLVIFAVPLVLPLLLSKYIHPVLHENRENRHWIYNNFYTRKIYETHYIHHQDDSKNFNLLLGGDWIMGTYEK
jgi:hypothetical protein